MEKEKLYHINTLRFIAVLYIMFHHYESQCFSLKYGYDMTEVINSTTVGHFLYYGWTGKYALAIMCIISGFILAYIYSQKNVNLSVFAYNRYLRLMLPCFAVNVIVFVQQRIGIYESVDFNSAFAALFWPGKNSLNPHFWCIGQFLIGSLLVLIYIQLFRNRKYYLAGYIIMFCLICQMAQVWVAGIVLGAFVYYLGEWLTDKKLNRWYILSPLLILSWWLIRDIDDNYSNRLFAREILAAALLVLVISYVPLLKKVFSLRRINSITSISYSLFVSHYITHFIAIRLFDVVENLGIHSEMAVFYTVMIIKLIIDVIIALPIYFVFEKKLYNLLRVRNAEG